MPTLTMPTVLSFDRKLEPSDAVMYSGNWSEISKTNGWEPIELFDRRNRAVKSNFKQEVLNDEEELKKQIEEPNLSWGDDATLPSNRDTLRVSFSLRVLGGINKPSACNKKDYQDKFTGVIDSYKSDIGFGELANRYACNIANGRFLWRNRVGAQEIIIYVKHNSLDSPLIFNAYDYPLNKASSEDDSVATLGGIIEQGLNDDNNIFIEVDAYAKLGNRQRVWPSQEMVLKIPKGEKSRHLFALDGNAAMHCEKIGNALRTIDDWQTGSESPIAIEAYGSVTQRGVAYRSSRNDFKTLLTKWMNDDDLSDIEKHFVVAMLIRGGVFSEGE
ncbi:MAG: type I-F CRISPR-associated protein Csy3 [Gammaproteobacteria bacterium]|nr:type I-F CRISPR-associated protein Csy3 [Gammaproteobacteria bacterium]